MQEAGRAVARQPGHWMETAAVFFSHTKLTLATNPRAIFFFSQQISISHSQQNRASSEVRKVGTRQRRINKAQANCNQFFLSARSCWHRRGRTQRSPWIKSLEPDPSQQHQQPRRRQPSRNKRGGGGAVAPSDRAILFKDLRNVSVERGRVSEQRPRTAWTGAL